VIYRWSLGRGVGGSWNEKDSGKVKSFEWRRLTVVETLFRKLNVVEDLSWTLGNMDSLVEVLGIRDTCSLHPDEGQILTTTPAMFYGSKC